MYPKLVFIIPYRNRLEQKFVFEKYMKYIMEDYKKNDYHIFFVEQKDHRDFNRGALKNIGFLAMKKNIPRIIKKLHLSSTILILFHIKRDCLIIKLKGGISSIFLDLTIHWVVFFLLLAKILKK